MKNFQKVIATFTLSSLMLCPVPTNLLAADSNSDSPDSRIFGLDRFETAVKVAQAGWSTSDIVIVAPASDLNLVDALAAAPLAGQENAPILLTEGNALNAKTKQALLDLKASKVYAVGALSDKVISDLKKISGLSVEVLKGYDRIETATKIAAKLRSPAGTFVVGYNALADALSVASFAAANNYQILVTNPNGTLPDSEKITGTTYLIGGSTLVSDLAGTIRLAGADRFETNQKVLASLNYNYNKVYVANGEQSHLVDSLVGSSLAAKDRAPILLGNTTSIKAAADISTKMGAYTLVVALGGSSILPDSVKNSVAYATSPITPITPVTPIVPNQPSSALAVNSISISSANSIKVTFNTPPTDASKITFAVTRSGTPIPVTTTWNSTRTEATLLNAINFTDGAYSVVVKNDAQDLTTSTVNFTEKGVAKISITSSKIALSNDGKAYVTYQAFDQYGNDITTSSLANNISFFTGIGTTQHRNGLITIIPNAGVSLIQLAQVVLTGQDTTSGVSTMATLTTTTAIGTLSKLTLNSLTHPENKVLTTGDSSSVWYIDYTATDISGNPTKDYNLVKNGLILSTANGFSDSLSTSSQYVRAQVVQDPLDYTKAAIQVTVDPTARILVDLPISINAMSYAGTNSVLNVTLKKAATTETFTLATPPYELVVGEQKAIPFSAYNQNGVRVDKYSDLKADNISFSPADKVKLSENVDGTASLLVGPFTMNGPQVITALTSTGKISTLTLTIQKAARADVLTLNNSVLVNSMQANASQKIDFGLNYGGFSVIDQYGRTMDMTGDPKTYQVIAISSNPVIINAAGTAAGDNAITISGGTIPGQASVTFNLVDTTNPNLVINSKVANFTVLQNSDISAYTIDPISSPIYAGSNFGLPFTLRDKEYAANPSIFGKTSGGAKVLLAGNPIKGGYVDNTTDFKVDAGSGAYDSVHVYAGTLPSTKSSANTNLTVNFLGADSTIHSLTTPITSSSESPSAKTINTFVSSFAPGISVNSTGDIITVELAKAAYRFGPGKNLLKFDASGNANQAGIYFYAVDQYNTQGIQFAQILKVASRSTLTDEQFNVTSDGTITGSGAVYGDVVLTAVTPNGLVKTIKLHFQ